MAQAELADELAGPQVWGIVNVTPDSFSDGGELPDAEAAVARGLHLVAAGADVIDVGGESTRPGAHRISAEEEAQRVLPVVTALAAQGVCVSIDTTRAVVAEQAVAAGARIVNDVSGGKSDPEMLPLIARLDCDYVVMHWRAPSDSMADFASYDDTMRDVLTELGEQLDACLAAGIDASRIIVDPGFGFAKDEQHNIELLGALPVLVRHMDLRGHRVLIGTSRKRFLGGILGGAGDPPPPAERDTITAATSLVAAQAGVWAVRVHAVRPTRDVLALVRVLAALPDAVDEEPM